MPFPFVSKFVCSCLYPLFLSSLPPHRSRSFRSFQCFFFAYHLTDKDCSAQHTVDAGLLWAPQARICSCGHGSAHRHRLFPRVGLFLGRHPCCGLLCPLPVLDPVCWLSQPLHLSQQLTGPHRPHPHRRATTSSPSQQSPLLSISLPHVKHRIIHHHQRHHPPSSAASVHRASHLSSSSPELNVVT